MAQSKRPINLSVCQIRKQFPGNQLATAGSACILKWPWDIKIPQPNLQATASSVEMRNQTFLVTTSQVVRNSDLDSSEPACKADFLPVNLLSTKTFTLNNLPCVPISGQNDNISLILIPTEPLHKQRMFSRWRRNEFQFDRAQLCDMCKESELQEAEAKGDPDRLYCYVACENASGNDNSFRLQCYVLEMGKNGSFFLRAPGNEAKLKKLRDFQRNEYPISSAILNENGDVVGFLAFGKNKEILPLFLPHYLQGDNQGTEAALVDSGTAEGCSSEQSDEQSNRSTDTEAERDVNKNKEDNLNPAGSSLKKLSDRFISEDTHDDSDDSQIRVPSSSELEDSYEGLNCNKNIPLPGKRSNPTELSFASVTREGNSTGDMEEIRGPGDGREEERIHPSSSSQPHSQGSSGYNSISMEVRAEDSFSTDVNSKSCGQLGNGASQEPEPQRPPIQRSQSETTTMTPRTERRLLLKSCSVPVGPFPLKSGDLVEEVILNHIYIMDKIKRCLDTTYTRNNNENWLHLAYRQGVDTHMITRLKCQSPESRSEALFQVLPTVDPDLSIGTLVCHLQELKMNNVVKCIEDLNLGDQMYVDEALDSGKIPGRFFTLLDQKPEETWNKLGSKLRVDQETLEGIKVDCLTRHQNPAQDVIEMICCKSPKMTIGQFKKHLENINREDVAKKLKGLPDKLTITDLRNDLNRMRVVTRKLNKPQMKNFKDLAAECGIPAEKYNSLQPPCADSPTEEVMKDIIGRKPFYTVDELFTDLREMNRSDVVEVISPYFIEEDVRNLKRQLKMSDE